jgi:hypothetical protein
LDRLREGGWYLVLLQPARLVPFEDSFKNRPGDTLTVECKGSFSLCKGTVYDPRNHDIELGQFEMSTNTE